MLKLRTSLLAATVAVAAVFSPLSQAVEATPPTSSPIQVTGTPISDRGMFHARGLNLTQAQQDQLFELRHQQEPEMRRLRNAIRDARTELRDLSNAATFDEAKAKASSEKLAKAEADLSLQRSRLHAQRMAVLTPEQRQQMQQQHAANRDQPRGGRPGNRGDRRGDMGSHSGPRHGGGQHAGRI
ncbi:Spy/CpxP family protein refolding chaperone [Paenalcaligenes sp. Me131]|uniref:Spy/CpxP family protein refolding chaperone n=1 Tax=Paenalcaligenes sp. Me131 TaxID=3392636 RepID=UPI003D2CAF61